MSWSRRTMVTAAAVGAVVLGASVAVASVPSANGTISGCRTVATGALRVIDTDAGQQCRTGERLLTWNQQGPAGTNGTNGTNGTSGTNGVSGYVRMHSTFVIAANSSHTEELLCPTGTRPLGGGGHAGNVFDDKGLANISHAYIAESDVNDGGNGWAVTAVNTFSDQAEFSIDVICAAV